MKDLLLGLVMLLGCSITPCVASNAYTEHRIPLKDPPSSLVNEFTLRGRIPLEKFYVDDTNRGEPTHFIFSNASMYSYLKASQTIFKKIRILQDRVRAGKISEAKMMNTLTKQQWIYLALTKYIIPPGIESGSFYGSRVSLNVSASSTFGNPRAESSSRPSHSRDGLKACVFGSTEPWVEAAMLTLGVSHVVTLEYNLLTYDFQPPSLANMENSVPTNSSAESTLPSQQQSIQTVSGAQMEQFYSCESGNLGTFDLAVSVSAFDHDGLGRYGDAINPHGDLDAMKCTLELLKPGGLLILTVPIGPDVLVFNLHRRYGEIRLPLLLRGFEVVERIAWQEWKLTEKANWRQTYEPVLVLRKPADSPNHGSICKAASHYDHLLDRFLSSFRDSRSSVPSTDLHANSPEADL